MKTFTMQTFAEFENACQIEEDRRRALPVTDPDHWKGYALSTDEKGAKWLSIYWGGYDYPIDLSGISRPIDLLRWLAHIAEKEWDVKRFDKLGRLIERIAEENGWDLYDQQISLTDKDERAKLTPQLRYKVLSRDGFKCCACGSTAKTGAFLQVDHRVAIANGGKTVLHNLQTLCSTCNYGKGHS